MGIDQCAALAVMTNSVHFVMGVDAVKNVATVLKQTAIAKLV